MSKPKRTVDVFMLSGMGNKEVNVIENKLQYSNFIISNEKNK